MNIIISFFPAGFSASPPVGSAPHKLKSTEPPTKRESASSSSPDTNEQDDFVMVPAHLTMDAAENRKTNFAQIKQSPGGRRHTVSGAPPQHQQPGHQQRPSNLPMQIGPTTEPIPVPTQKAAYMQIQQSLVRSRSRSGDSVSAMSGISSASGGSTLGPLPEERVAAVGGAGGMENQSPAVLRKQSRVSPLSSPRSPMKQQLGEVKTRRVSAPPIPDICQMSPPNVQFTLGSTPPSAAAVTFTLGGHRRRTSSSSSCGTPPPPGQWQISPHSPATGVSGVRMNTPTMASPSRRTGAPLPAGAIPALSPIQGSPNKASLGDGGQGAGAVGGRLTAGGAEGGVGEDCRALMQWETEAAGGTVGLGDRAFTVPEGLSRTGEAAADPVQGAAAHVGLRRRSSDMQLLAAAGRNVVLNYGVFDKSGSWSNFATRRGQSLPGGKENTAPPPALLAMPPPPALSEETLMGPEHKEILAKLKYISVLVDTIIEVARNKAAPLSAINETVVARTPGSCPAGELDPSSPLHRRLQQLLLYMRCLHLLSQTLDYSRAELKAKKLKPSTSVKNSEYFTLKKLGSFV